jgi:rhodanese-related sulfurtransferase
MSIRDLVVTVAAVGCIAWAGAAAPNVAVDESTYQFGSVLEGSFVTHRFVLANRGDQPLTDLRAVSMCGCTTSALPFTTLNPGDSIEIEVVFDTAGYGGLTVTKSVDVRSNDPDTPHLWLYLAGDVRRLQPYHVDLSDLQYRLYILVDLRAPEVYAERHIIGAVNIPYEALASTMGLLPSGHLIIFYDADGTQSDAAAQLLIQSGFPDAKSLIGGFDLWVSQLGTTYLWPLGQ